MIFLSVFYFDQMFNLFVSLFTKKKEYGKTDVNHNYAFLICARNEENVIANLVNSIKEQNYPMDKINIFVVSDNSTDKTKQMAQNAGAIVFERFDKENVGKSYAMDWAFKKIMAEYSDLNIEAFIIVDADNLLDKNFTYEMNKAYDYAIRNNKTRVITGFRAPKNYKASWVAAGSSYLLLREDCHMHHSRCALGVGTYVSGTGYLMDYGLIKEFGGWPYHTLVEDIEISTDLASKGEKILFCEKAVFYDEQPKTLKYSWRQRMRWCRGTHEVFFKYSWKIVKSFFKKFSLTKWEMFVHISPVPALTFLWICSMMAIGAVYAIITNTPFIDYFNNCMLIGLKDIIGSLGITLIIVIFVMIQYWKRFNCNAFYKIFYALLFPFFMGLYLPITTIALFVRVSWKEIKHSSYYDKKKI